ncbi:MAG: M15 family metallopeptidase, partial [Acetatifactor sp.]|nr:M15 family metallopeptidase [Acetatifactor sp.]
NLTESFADTDAGKWLAENGYKYGFILRYPKGKEYITGIEFEPWHFRYVGVDAATVITERGITLEEFWEEL